APRRRGGRHGAPVEIAAEMARPAVDVIIATIVPDAADEDRAELAADVRQFADGAGAISLPDLLGLPAAIPGLRRLRALRATRAVRARARRIVTRRRQVAERGRCPAADDLVALMLAARTADTDAAMSEREVEDNVSMFLGAGSDTVAQALTWALYLLAQSPTHQGAVEQELDEVVGDGPMTAGLVERLPFTRAVIEEAMRLYPPSPLVSRAARNDDVLCGRAIAAGSVIMIAPWLIHRHRRLWDDPLVFDPRRFLPPRREQIRRFSYLPFGAGPRLCIGMNFAM